MSNAKANSEKRAEARAKGLRLAARVATVGGIAVAALGLVEARAAASAAHAAHAAPSVTEASLTSADAANDDTRPAIEGGWMKAGGGSCGCSPCWGPPAPPERTGVA